VQGKGKHKRCKDAKRRGPIQRAPYTISIMPLALTPAQARTTFTNSLRLIFDHPEQRGLIHTEMQTWYRIFQQSTQVDAFDFNATPSIMLPTGEALGTAGAAFCLLEAQRTAVFLRGITQAIRDLQQHFPNERIRILYAGCGPFATLLTPLTAIFTAQQVGWHLLDVNQNSLNSVHHLYQALNLQPYLLDTQLADATTFVMPTTNPFHLVISETMQRALQNEPQLAIMLNLIPQLQPRALFLPQCIAIHAALLLPSNSSTDEVLPPTFQTLATIYEVGQSTATPPQQTPLTIPPLDTPADLHLTTGIQVYKNETLSGNDTSITLPKDLRRRLHGGEHLIFRYQWQPHPGFICETA